jgi:hypothetical protein
MLHDTIATTASAHRGRHLAFLILMVVGVATGWVQVRFFESIYPKVSVMGYPPVPLRMAWLGCHWLFVLPLVTGVLWILSGRAKWAGGRVSFALQAFVLLLAHLSVAYLALVPASFLGFFPDGRMSWDARSIFGRATELRVLALDPGMEIAPTTKVTETNFHGYDVTGAVTVSEPTQVTNLVSAVFRSIDEAWLPGAICFRPHHGLIVKSPKSEMHLVICYECDRVNVYAKGQVWQGVITSRSMPVLNAVLEPHAPKSDTE